MKIYQVRNATMIIEADDKVILIDPMLGGKGCMPSLSYFRFKSQRNPTVPLPAKTESLLQKVTHCLITHKHADHIDQEGEQFLKRRNIPVICSALDESIFRRKGLDVIQTVNYWQKSEFLEGEIMGVPARHGYGFIAKPMGNVMGFFITLPNQPSVYISSDTIMTNEVEKALREHQPDISIAACGTAQLDIGKPLLMHLDDIVKFVKASPGKIIANHLEAVNHCPTTRKELAIRLKTEGILDKVYIPEDGEVIEF